MSFKKSFLIFFIFISFILVFKVGYFLGQKKSAPLFLQDWNLLIFQEAYDKLRKNFIDGEKIDNQRLFYGALTGMVSALNDPYTQFFDPQKAVFFLQEASGEFGGVGIEIGVKNNLFTIISPLENTPAQKAGLKSGDVIIMVDRKIISHLPLDEVITLIRGEPNTEVVLTVIREGWNEPKDFKLKREIIKVPNLKFEVLKSSQGENIPYLRIYQFNDNTLKNFEKTLPLILKEKREKIILDLRGNSGGYLETAREIANYFLKRNEVILIEQEKNDQKLYLAKNDGILSNYRAIILVDGGTASAAEILAVALQENQKALLLGEKTFGKGSVQKLEQLKDGSLLKITFAYWLSPKGKKISEKGLMPDIEVKNDESEKDLQLERALKEIDLLKK
ncbi:MAG: S41 family peptidase [Minisyncoccales bacterium]